MDMLFSFKNRYHYTYLNSYMFPALLPHYLCAVWNDWFGWVEARLPVKVSEIGSGSLANEGTSIRGMETKFFELFVCVTGNFGVRKV